MPQTRGLYLRVGALVVAGLALALGFVLFLTATRFGSSGVTYETYLRESVQGLDVGSPVRYRGVSIGRVAEVGLVAAEYRRPQGNTFGTVFQLVFVRFSVDTARIGEVPSIDEAIRLGLRVRIAAQGITGVNYLELDFVDPNRFPPREVPWEPRYPYIPAVPSTVAQVQSAAEQLLQKLQDANLPGLLDNVIGLVADLRGQVQDGDLATTLKEAAAAAAHPAQPDGGGAGAGNPGRAARRRDGCPRPAGQPRRAADVGQRRRRRRRAAHRGGPAAGQPQQPRRRAADRPQRHHRPPGGAGADPARPARRGGQPARHHRTAAPLSLPGHLRRAAARAGATR